MLRVTLNEPVPLKVFVPDGNSSLFTRVRVVDAAGSLVTTLSLVHQLAGLYAVTWTPGTEGYYTAIYDLFLDAGFTMPADYDPDIDLIEVSSDKINILRLLGLHHENALLDMEVYGSNGRLASARLRKYDTAVNLAAAAASSPSGGTVGLMFEWTIGATYDGMNQSKTFQIARVT